MPPAPPCPAASDRAEGPAPARYSAHREAPAAEGLPPKPREHASDRVRRAQPRDDAPATPYAPCRDGQRSTRQSDRHRGGHRGDRKSTRLNSSHVAISYAVFCLKKKSEKKR